MNRLRAVIVLVLMPVALQAQMDTKVESPTLDHTYHIAFESENIYESFDKKLPSPAGALLRSFILPSWGHYYADSNSLNRGLMHLGADLALLGAYLGYTSSANRIERNLVIFASQHARVNVSNRPRDFRLSVAEFNSLDAYNEYQLRSRNWDKILEVNASNYWNWDSDLNRRSFVNMDTRVQDQRQQLPAVISLMVVNRIVAGIHAFSQARGIHENASMVSFTIPQSGSGLQANYRLSF